MLEKQNIFLASGFLVALLALLQCSRSPNEPDASNLLIGSWRWVESCGGFAGRCLTPDSAGYEKLIIFSSDSMYYEYGDDSLVWEKRFSVEKREWIANHDTLEAMLIDGWHIEMIINFSGANRLWLDENCYDCFGHLYVRLDSI